MDISRLADLLKNKASSALEDYSQLADAYPNLKNFAGALVGNVERNVPTQAELQNPEAMQQRALGYMSPMAGAIKGISKNLNADLIQKYLKEGRLSPEEMTQYEANALAMETPNLQRYNVENANLQGGTPESRAGALGYSDNWRHGRYSDYEQINPNKTFYATQDPDYASIYAVEPSASSMGGKGLIDYESLKPNVMPVLIKKGEILDTRLPEHSKIFNKDFYMKYGNATPLTDKKLPDWVEGEDFREMFEEVNPKFKGVFLDEGKIPTWEGGLKDRGVSAAIFDPSAIRSRFAAFDPLRSASPSLLAGGASGSLLLNEEMNKGK